MNFGLLVFAFIALAVLVTALKSFRVVGQASVMIIERLGSFHKMAGNGLNIILPFIDKPRAAYWSGIRPGLSTLDLREQLLEFPPQPVITRDNVTVNVDSVLYYQITDPIKAMYEVADLTGSIMQLTITSMRSIIGDLDLDHTFSSRDVINTKLRIVLDEATERWGVKVTRVEVRNIHPPEDLSYFRRMVRSRRQSPAPKARSRPQSRALRVRKKPRYFERKVRRRLARATPRPKLRRSSKSQKQSPPDKGTRRSTC